MLLILNILSNEGYFQKRQLVNADSKGFRETIKAGEIGASLTEIYNTRDYQIVNRKMVGGRQALLSANDGASRNCQPIRRREARRESHGREWPR